MIPYFKRISNDEANTPLKNIFHHVTVIKSIMSEQLTAHQA